MMPTEPVTFRTYVIFDNRCPAPRRKDEPMNPPANRFFYSADGETIHFGTPNDSHGRACPADPMNDGELLRCRLSAAALAEILRRRPDPAKAQAELERLRGQLDRADQSAAAWEAHDKTLGNVINNANIALNNLGAPDAGQLVERIVGLAAKWTSSADYGQSVLTGHLDNARADCAALRAQLRDPVVLRAALARIDAKAAEIATLKARLAELENE